MKVLVITAAREQKINANLLNILTAASAISDQCTVMVIGKADCSAISQYQCVHKVLNLPDIQHEQNLASYVAQSLAAICTNESTGLLIT